MNLSVRKAAVAGMFYPAEPYKLKDTLDSLFEMVETKQLPISKPVVVVAPHAGYTYSGLTAAFAYKAIAEYEYDTYVILSPSHREFFPFNSIFPGDAYSTPFGLSMIDAEAREILTKSSDLIKSDLRGHKTEHGVEVHLPFLQHSVTKEFRILPVVMGEQSPENISALAEGLIKLSEQKSILVIVSTDLSHFYAGEEANELDGAVAEAVLSGNANTVANVFKTKTGEACGAGLLVAGMLYANNKGFTRAVNLHQCNSGDTTSDYREVVGYLSSVVY